MGGHLACVRNRTFSVLLMATPPLGWVPEDGDISLFVVNVDYGTQTRVSEDPPSVKRHRRSSDPPCGTCQCHDKGHGTADVQDCNVTNGVAQIVGIPYYDEVYLVSPRVGKQI